MFRPDEDFHLEDVSLGSGLLHECVQQRSAVQTEGASNVCRLWIQKYGSEHIRTSRYEFPFEVPSIHPGASRRSRVSCALDNVEIALALHLDHLRHVLWMVGEIGVHDEDKFTSARFETVDVGSAETEFASTGAEDDAVCAPNALQLLGNV